MLSKVEKNYTLSPCGGPTGIAIDVVNHRIFTVCRENKGLSVVDINSGKVIQTLPIGGGVDAVVYDAHNKLIFVSNGDGTATIFKQESAVNRRNTGIKTDKITISVRFSLINNLMKVFAVWKQNNKHTL